MRVIETVREMQAFSESVRMEGKRIALVPTMGYLHEGHLSLMKEGRKRSDCLIISIYVNPTQFGPSEDLDKYPRDFVRDEKLAMNEGVDVIFYPSNQEMYPDNYQTYVNVEGVTNNLCGLSRPGHFQGVTTVCAKLFNITKPHLTVFGKKDFQQYVTIKRMVADLNMDLEVLGLATVRESDGLAMSSRNTYLKQDERESALSLSRSLKRAKELYEGGERNAATIIDEMRALIEGYPHTAIDYIKICDTLTMNDVETLDRESVVALAVRVGLPRLIDNYVFGDSLEL
ncbi:MAG: pantoate--beta-alanine ligase [Deltaproteobacteria bacterium]|nr:pantoate--beta-alanine ligase [Deltaproteobacteria bacterium]MBN2688263.1 pantoate--beta-alanine ligase [Deltaproteobacteria bacterium]